MLGKCMNFQNAQIYANDHSTYILNLQRRYFVH